MTILLEEKLMQLDIFRIKCCQRFFTHKEPKQLRERNYSDFFSPQKNLFSSLHLQFMFTDGGIFINTFWP